MHLHPGMGHGAAGFDAEKLIGNGTGSAVAAADISGTGTQNGSVGTLGTAGTEFQHRPSLGRTDHAVCLGGDQALMVDGQQQEGFDQLCLNGRGTDRQDRLLGENRRTLGNGPNIAGELEMRQVIQEFLAEQVPAPEILDVRRFETQFLDIVDDLLQAGGNGKSAAVGTLAVKHIEISDLIPVIFLEIAVGHGQLIEVTQHGQIDLVIYFH